MSDPAQIGVCLALLVDTHHEILHPSWKTMLEAMSCL